MTLLQQVELASIASCFKQDQQISIHIPARKEYIRHAKDKPGLKVPVSLVNVVEYVGKTGRTREQMQTAYTSWPPREVCSGRTQHQSRTKN
jgi:hypothetical protein